MSEDPESNIRNSKIAATSQEKESGSKVGPRVASLRNSMSEDPESNIRNSRLAQSPQCKEAVQNVKLRSFSSALRTFDENFDKNSCKNSDDKNSCKNGNDKNDNDKNENGENGDDKNVDSGLSRTSFDKSNLLNSTALDAIFCRSLDEKLLALEIPLQTRRKSSAIKYLKLLGMGSENSPYSKEETPNSLSANLGIFNTIPSKRLLLPFADRKATSLPSDVGKNNMDFGSDNSDDSDDEDDNNDIHVSSSDSIELDREKVRQSYHT